MIEEDFERCALLDTIYLGEDEIVPMVIGIDINNKIINNEQIRTSTNSY